MRREAFDERSARAQTGGRSFADSQSLRQLCKAAAAPASADRVGIELFDPPRKIGAMASFDLGAGGVGARIMMLLSGGRVALFTGEGKPRRDGNRLSLGPLALESQGGEMLLSFHGHAVIVPDATHYLSIERALASGWLDESMEVAIRLRPGSAATPDSTSSNSSRRATKASAGSVAHFGKLSGRRVSMGSRLKSAASAAAGLSFTGLGSATLQLAQNDLGLLR